MRICLVSQEYPPQTAHGGIGTQTWNKAHTLTGLGHDVHVVSCGGHGAEPLVTQIESGITVHRMAPPGEQSSPKVPIYDQAAYTVGYTWSVLDVLTRLMQTTSFDLINFPEYGAEGFAFQINRTRWNWVPIIVQLHGPLALFAERVGWPDKNSNEYRTGTFMEGESIRMADWLMASSANIADFVAEHYGVDRQKIDVVHCGIDCEMFCPSDVGEQEHNGRPTVLFVGNLNAAKGLMTVFESVLRLRQRHPDIRLRVLGRGDTELAARLQRKAEAGGAGSMLELCGFVKDRAELPAFYRAADVFASPAAHEPGVANVYVEAMACGCPVVAATSGGAPEAVLDGRTGLTVPPHNVDATTAALDCILSDAALRRQMSQAARQWTQEYFSTDRYVERVLTAYNRAVESARTKQGQLEDEQELTSP